MNTIVVVFKNPTYREEVDLVTVAERKTKEHLVIDEKAKTWCFADKKLDWLGTFPFGKGPTSEQKEGRRTYPKTQTVLDKSDNKQLTEAFTFLSSEAFGLGYDHGSAIEFD